MKISAKERQNSEKFQIFTNGRHKKSIMCFIRKKIINFDRNCGKNVNLAKASWVKTGI